jgi:flavin reductase (DIM6/NTAB) family NADH-FMN oxidoreductase RutF
MKQKLLAGLCVLFLFSCGNQSQKSENEGLIIEDGVGQEVEPENVKDMNFDELFTNIPAEELTDNVFKLVGEDITVITAGDATHFNSMAASWGGVGILFNKPTTWCFLRSSRYTLELIKKEQTYTMSYFPEEYKEQVLFFGSKSGRDTDKMKEITLTPVQTPDGNTTYKEARLILECKLTELTTVSPDDFYTQEGKDFIVDAYKETKGYHKMVLGEITHIWVRK